VKKATLRVRYCHCLSKYYADLVELNFLKLCVMHSVMTHCQNNTVTLSCISVYTLCSFIITVSSSNLSIGLHFFHTRIARFMPLIGITVVCGKFCKLSCTLTQLKSFHPQSVFTLFDSIKVTGNNNSILYKIKFTQ